MRKKLEKEFQIRIRRDGMVFISSVDDTILDIWADLDPENPAVVKRRKAKKSAESRSPESR